MDDGILQLLRRRRARRGVAGLAAGDDRDGPHGDSGAGTLFPLICELIGRKCYRKPDRRGRFVG